MTARVDAETRTIELAVADLLDAQLLRSLGFANRGGYERLWLGQAIHSRYQEQSLAGDPTYRREVTLGLDFEHNGWAVHLRGRLDGLRRDPDGTRVVEEIKSVRRGGQLSPAAREIYHRQAQLYAWMLHSADGEAVRAELVLIEIGSDEVERQEVAVDLRIVDATVRRHVNGLLITHEQQLEARQNRRMAAGVMRFPFPELRPGQEAIVAAVEAALEGREHLLLEATTGIGKTVAALFPALKHCLAHGKRLYVLTAKTLQQEMVATVLEMLNQHRVFHGLRLRAKSKMCANDQVVCHEEYCPYAKDYYQKLQSSDVVNQLIERGVTLDPDAIFAAARSAEVCPFEVSLELGDLVEVTVCDYNYAFEPYVALADFSAEADLSNTVLVIDEIHNLVARGRGYYSPELGAEPVRRAAAAVGRGGDLVHVQIERLLHRLAALVEETVEGALAETPGADALETRLPEDALWKLRPAFDGLFVDYLEHRRETRTIQAEDPFVTLYFAFLRFLNGLMVSDESFSHCVERRAGSAWIRILCKDPSRFLGAVIRRAHTVIGLSATLSPPEFYRDLLGFEAGRTSAVSVPSPFPPEHRRLVIDASVSTTWRERARYYDKIAERLAAFAESIPGNCLALFPSYDFLAEVAQRTQLQGKRLLLQRRADGDREREEILETLRQALFGDVLLYAVAGGVFAEGVDYPGEMLKAVAVVGPCLPAVNLDQRLLQEYYEARFDRGFEFAFVVPGLTRVVQAAGRLIRSAEDTGVIALFDRRFLHRPYRQHLPADWLPEEGVKGLVGSPEMAARQFFASLSATALDSD